MTETRFLASILTEGVFLLILGLGTLILPKITPVSFGLILSFAFLAYGGYKIINSYILRNFSRHYFISIFAGICLLISGILIMITAITNSMLIIIFCGIYFVLESVSSMASASMTNRLVYGWKCFILLAILQILIGISFITLLPSGAIWLAGILTGLNFLVSGAILINIYWGTKYTKYN